MSTGMQGRTFTPEQRAAIESRTGSSLLAANAGSGKTAVMVERIAAAVREDGVPVGAILALTFTEKAAGELAERLRRRLAELGLAEQARAVDGAWIGTIHGFCARLLRSQPLAAGLDPRFEVLEETAAERLAGAAYERALEAWGRSPAAIDLAASYGQSLRELILATYATLRARGHERPRLTVPPQREAPDPAPLLAARDAALRDLATAGDGLRVTAAREALERCGEIVTAGAVPWPGALNDAMLKTGAKALESDACEAYREAWDAYRSACADYHAGPAIALLDALLARFTDEYAAAKAERGAVDFDDLELRTVALLEDPETRRSWAERFALIMIDEFQDTNAVQLQILTALERDNLFAVGDEFQSIYRFRHADVRIFRERAASLPPERVRGLRANFRSREELLDALNATFAPVLGERFQPLKAGRAAPPQDEHGALQLFALGPPPGEPPVELLVTSTRGWEELAPRLGLAGGGDQPWRRAEARAVAHRLRTEVDNGTRPGDIVVLVRATASLRLFEEALEDQGLPTYVVGGRGYWSQEQVRDGLAWLRVLANPYDEEALLTVLSSPFANLGTDELVRLAEAGRARGSLWAALQAGPAHREIAALLAAEREHAERAPLEILLERAIVATGYDLAVLARPGGDRRLANLRKLMRLAGEYERAEGRDLRGFLAEAAARDLAAAREGEAALESEGLDAIRLMTIHRSKGLEFPVVCVADLGRSSGARRLPLLVGADGTTGLRLAPLGGGETIPTSAWERLAKAEAEADAEEERRLFYVALTRAKDLLILSGGTDVARWPAPRPGGPPIDWIAPALAGPEALRAAAAEPTGAARLIERSWDGRPARVKLTISTPETFGTAVLPEAALHTRPRSRAASTTALPATPAKVPPVSLRPRPAQQRLSYSQLSDYARCGYRFYLQRVLRLPPVQPPQPEVEVEISMDARVRGSIVHRLLEDLDFARPQPPTPEAVRAVVDEPLTDEQVEDIRALVDAFAGSPLRARLAAAARVTREAWFAFALDPDGSGPLVRGIVDVLAHEADGTHLIVDYKTDKLEGPPDEYVARAYETQRLVYALAALRAGAPRVEVAYCLLERPAEPVTAVYHPDDAPDLANALAGLASGILHRRYPVTGTPHRELCGDCPGRDALCSHPPELTLRPPPAPWPGEPARRSPPAGAAIAAGQPPR